MPRRAVGETILRGKIWYARYYDARGKRHQERAGTLRVDAERLLRQRLKAKDDGLPVTPQMGKLRFADAARDLLNDYTVNGRRSIDEARRRLDKHLLPFFGTLKMSTISTDVVRQYIAQRMTDTIRVKKARVVPLPDGGTRHEAEIRRPVSPAEINRELTTLKRAFSLAIQAGKLLHKPHIPLLKEADARTGFFEAEQFRSVRSHLPAALQPIVTFAYITGWRITSEVLPLEWRNVDWNAGDIRLDPGTTKNGEGRVFPMTDDLRALLQGQHAEHERMKQAGHLCPYVFFREVADERGGEKKPQPVKAFAKAWRNACRLAGCPGRIPHDLRRTAVRNMVRAGLPESVSMRLTGHKTRSVFERYNITSGADLRAAADRLSGQMGPSTGPTAGATPAVAVGSGKFLRKSGGAARN